jgi:hypothetical protein
MCKGLDCPHKEKCKRFTSKPDRYRQAYFFLSPIKDGKCDYFWGENAELIWNQLKEITNESNNNVRSK